MDSVGDLARSLVLRTNQVRLREEMDTLAVEIATGFVKDSGQHLNGDLSSLMGVDRSLARLEAFRINTTEAKYITGTMQTTLDEMQSRSQTLSQTLIAAELTPSGALLNSMSNDARDGLSQTLNALNRSVAGRFLFSGTATDRASVMTLDSFMTEVTTALAGQTDLAGIDAALDTFFGAGGGYESTVYQGSNDGLSPMRLSENETASVDIRATDPVFRELLKPLAMAAIAADDTMGLTQDVQAELLARSGNDLLGVQKSIVELRAGLGSLEARIEETSTRNAAEITATSMARLELVGADQYDSASRYENIRGQLESLYAITARSQRLSLAEYL
ncbi:MAG: flagellin [Pelagimonas sp.]|jgi:flagellar hook-associated protein 3 FlgL|nr:flagellin [Pelagimonas sp.]